MGTLQGMPPPPAHITPRYSPHPCPLHFSCPGLSLAKAKMALVSGALYLLFLSHLRLFPRSRLGTSSACCLKTSASFITRSCLFTCCELSEGSDRVLNISKPSILRTELTQKRLSDMCRWMGGNLWECGIYFGKPNKGSRHF